MGNKNYQKKMYDFNTYEKKISELGRHLELRSMERSISFLDGHHRVKDMGRKGNGAKIKTVLKPVNLGA